MNAGAFSFEAASCWSPYFSMFAFGSSLEAELRPVYPPQKKTLL
jgi:hypothetical protein